MGTAWNYSCPSIDNEYDQKGFQTGSDAQQRTGPNGTAQSTTQRRPNGPQAKGYDDDDDDQEYIYICINDRDNSIRNL